MAYSRMQASVIDRASRDHFARVLRHFAAGLMTTSAFESRFGEAVSRTRDLGVERVFCDGAYLLYHDLWPYRLRGRNRLSHEQRREVARMILFLHSDLPYEWPAEEGWWLQNGESRMGCLGWFARQCGCPLPDPPKMSKELRDSMHIFRAVWPFRRVEGFEEARRHPRLLAG